jgi:hypothetical protein
MTSRGRVRSIAILHAGIHVAGRHAAAALRVTVPDLRVRLPGC